MTNARNHQIFIRRKILAGAARAAGVAISAPLLNAVATPAHASNWRGVVGSIKPNARPSDSSLVDMIRILPDGIGEPASVVALALEN